jgi:8-hydroxy-5-deazaflavin:NADPH oxidoreductase
MKQEETAMRIAIIGTGNVGGAIARGLKGKGHVVLIGARDPQAADVVALASDSGATPMLPTEAAETGDVIVLALPWGVAEGAVQALGSLAGKTVIDCMNPLGMVNGALGLLVGHTSSGGEMVQGWLPQAHVVKTLNQVGAEMMAQNDHLPQRPVMFMAGNDSGAKTRAATLLADLGFQPLDAGDITKARLLEPFALVWINQALFRGKGRDWAFTVTTKGT